MKIIKFLTHTNYMSSPGFTILATVEESFNSLCNIQNSSLTLTILGPNIFSKFIFNDVQFMFSERVQLYFRII
jgi:hypothetical protein